MGRIIAVANQKGGVGKTTTAVNLSACLAYKGKKTLLIDGDPQGNATSGLGIQKNSAQLSTYDILISPEKTAEAAIKMPYSNLHVIISDNNLSGAEIELAPEERREYFLKDALAYISGDFDYIIIDAPPALGMITLNILTACDSVLIPIQCEYYALEGLTQLTATLRAVKKKLNPDIEIEGILATMFDGRTKLSVHVLDEIGKYFPDKLYKTVIPRNVRLSEAPSFGVPVIKYDITSKGAESYFALAKEIINKYEQR